MQHIWQNALPGKLPCIFRSYQIHQNTAYLPNSLTAVVLETLTQKFISVRILSNPIFNSVIQRYFLQTHFSN